MKEENYQGRKLTLTFQKFVSIATKIMKVNESQREYLQLRKFRKLMRKVENPIMKKIISNLVNYRSCKKTKDEREREQFRKWDK